MTITLCVIVGCALVNYRAIETSYERNEYIKVRQVFFFLGDVR